MASRFGRLFDVVLSIGVVVACVLYGRTVWTDFSSPALPPALKLPELGVPAPSLFGHRYQEAEATILLYLSSSCKYCTESMPFYRTLVYDIAESRKQIHVVALGREPRAHFVAYLSDHGLAVSSERPDSTQWDFLRVTPTVLVVNRQGIAMASFVGQLGPEDQDKLRSLLGLR